jgi:hypothetical protein
VLFGNFGTNGSDAGRTVRFSLVSRRSMLRLRLGGVWRWWGGWDRQGGQGQGGARAQLLQCEQVWLSVFGVRVLRQGEGGPECGQHLVQVGAGGWVSEQHAATDEVAEAGRLHLRQLLGKMEKKTRRVGMKTDK